MPEASGAERLAAAGTRDTAHGLARGGVGGPASALPHGDTIQRAFGRHDVSRVRAHGDGRAAGAARALDARAFTVGEDVAFDAAPGLFVAAHEAAHVVQQRWGAGPVAGVGSAGDPHERHADAVAAQVVAGRDATPLLDRVAHATPSPRPAVQRFGAEEHRDIGNEATARSFDRKSGRATGALMVRLAPDYPLTYGEIVALAGDHFESVDQMRKFAANTSGGAGSRAEIEYAREWKLGLKGARYDAAAKASQEARYYALAGRNRRHFLNAAEGDAAAPLAARLRSAPDPTSSNPDLPDALVGYHHYHVRALRAAATAGAAKAGLDAALAEEAFGGHFLTDSFSAGHVRTERASIATHWQGKHPMFNANLKGLLAQRVALYLSRNAPWSSKERWLSADMVYDPVVVDGALATITTTLDRFGPLSLGDLVSGAVHDWDNETGVEAVVGRRRVTLFGDGSARKGGGGGFADTQAVAAKAVRLGVAEVRRAFRLGGSKPPDAVVAAIRGRDGLFAPQRMLPRAVAAQTNPKPVWKHASLDDLLNDKQMAGAITLFAAGKAGEIRGALSSLSALQKKAVEHEFITPLTSDPVRLIRDIIDWTPDTGGGVLGHNTDDNAVDYWKQARGTRGGLASLTLRQRQRLITHLLEGATVGEDEDAIMSILTTAPRSDQASLIRFFGWENLHDEIDDGPGNEFADTFPKPAGPPKMRDWAKPRARVP